MEGLRTQPDLHDLLRMEDDVLSPKGDVSPERLQHSLNSSASKINTPAKVLMVGEPVQVKTEERQEKAAGNTDGATNPDLSSSSNEELADGIRTPSPETAAAMESFIADDDLTAASPKLGAKPPTPVSFTASANTNKLILRPQTSSVTTVKANQPISIAGKKFMVATQPLQVMRRDGAGGPIFTKLVVKRTTTATAATHKSPVVFTKTRGLSPAKNSLKSGSIVLSPIKGGFKIPISPIKSPIKVSVIPPSNTKKMPALGKPITVPISMPQLQQKIQPGASNTRTVMNGLLSQGGKNFISQQHITVQNRQPTAPNQSHGTNRQVIQQLHVIQSPTQSIQDSQGAKIQYVQILPTANNTQHPTIRSNQGQPITFTSMSPLNGGNLSLNQPGGTIAFLPQNIQKAQPQSSSSSIERQPQTVKVTIPGQATHQIKPQRLIMPATSAPRARAGITPITPGSVIPQGNIGYAMVPAREFEELTRRINVQNSFSQDATIHPVPKPVTSGKIGANGKLKKPCNCTKSQCLKLYCECFANGQFCDECNCINCFNNLDHEAERSKAVKQCLERNPAAFRPKIGRGKDDNRTHQKGCNCKRSGCLKNYCECYEARIPCTSKCKCIGCKNYEDTGERRSLMSLADAAEVRVQQQTAAKTKLSNQIGDIKPAARTTITGERLPYTFFTPEVIEATCTCLLAQAEEAEKTNRPMAVAEAMILEEFGRCVMQIIQSAGKAKVSHFN